jgi:hypothetical protein
VIFCSSFIISQPQKYPIRANFQDQVTIERDFFKHHSELLIADLITSVILRVLLFPEHLKDICEHNSDLVSVNCRSSAIQQCRKWRTWGDYSLFHIKSACSVLTQIGSSSTFWNSILVQHVFVAMEFVSASEASTQPFLAYAFLGTWSNRSTLQKELCNMTRQPG